MSFLSRYKDVIVCILALVIPFFFLKANLKEADRLNAVDRVLLTISTPIQWAATAVIETVGDVWSDYVFLVGVKEENDRLRFDNQRLRAENNLYLETEQEVRRLRRMLTFRETFGAELKAARVVSRGISEQFRIVRIVIDLGENDSLEKGMAVATFDGLVGQVNTFAGGYSDILLTVDLLRSDEVREGDQLFTSGAGGKFPAGILAGRIVSVQRENLGLFQKVVVEPAVNFSRLREVFVIVGNPDTEERVVGASDRQSR